jgi:hypothetical protein
MTYRYVEETFDFVEGQGRQESVFDNVLNSLREDGTELFEAEPPGEQIRTAVNRSLDPIAALRKFHSFPLQPGGTHYREV